MATGTYDVLLRPFREVVKYGQLGQARAQVDPDHPNHAPLRAAAKALGNEGERALKKIAPMLLQPTPEFSEFLLDLALHQDDVTLKFRDIDIVLYDLEDYIDLDSFEKEKFEALQTEIKAVAIVLLDKIRRRAAETSLDTAVAASTAPPPLPPSPTAPFVPLPRPPSSSNGSHRNVASPTGVRHPPSRTRGSGTQTPQGPSKPLPDSPGGLGYSDGTFRHDYHHAPAHAHRQAPRSNSASNASYARHQVSGSDGTWYADDAHHQQQQQQYGRHSNPHANQHMESLHNSMDSLNIRTDMQPHHRPLSPESLPSTHPSIASSTFSPVHYRSSLSTSIPENELPPDEADWSSLPPKANNYSVVSSSGGSSYDQYGERQAETQVQQLPGYYGNGSAVATFDERQLVNRTNEPVSPISDSVNTFGGGGGAAESRVSSVRASVSSGTKTDGGRISIKSSAKSRPLSRGNLGLESSYGMHKGFCRGAQRFLVEGPGSAVKKVGGGSNGPQSLNPHNREYEPEFHSMFSTPIGHTDPMAQCFSCEYKINYSQLLQDMQQDPLSNQQSHGLRYRLRFLFKSHVATRDLYNVYFACLFCAQQGGTCRESDATVFPSVNLLFRHLSRHPMPLPEVAGVTVLYDNVPTNQPGAQDYDLHIPNPEANAEAIAALEEAENEALQRVPLPTARATKDHLQRRNEKPLPRPGPTDPILNALEVLQFMAGAKITHVDFPDRWDGKWCRGYHDGVFGVFPSKLIDLEAPSDLDLANMPWSGCNAVTRWKWEQKGSASSPWLKLGKGEKVTSITWNDVHAWYWIGKNSQGKMGIFPKSHIKIESLNDGSHGEAAAKPAKPQSGFSSLFGRKG
ncbi:hypothetical protein B0I35DRAFT_449376 [Stachybotrys elegans]|uniref:SH3 domain-containing protein n=1 Tax=Stachybotrys elegans TaxID=80388 RepID=A0A8K0SXP4_9HYPO|nr:hypothetical protein B0I35DRAFT_449376 [Stachybotrys elegans]